MKTLTGINLSILLLTTTFSALAEEEATTVNAQKKSYTVAGCDPMPDCQIDFMIGQESSTLQRWLDQLKMKQSFLSPLLSGLFSVLSLNYILQIELMPSSNNYF